MKTKTFLMRFLESTKSFVTIFALILLPLLGTAKSYNYSAKVTSTRGNDYFLFDKTQCNEVVGSIQVTDSLLILDGVKYPLKPRRKPNLFKSKKCSFKFEYENGSLIAIRLIRYDTVTSYYLGGTN